VYWIGNYYIGLKIRTPIEEEKEDDEIRNDQV